MYCSEHVGDVGMDTKLPDNLCQEIVPTQPFANKFTLAPKLIVTKFDDTNKGVFGVTVNTALVELAEGKLPDFTTAL